MSAPLGPGDRVSRYRIEAVLGEGGMGRVYRAFDERLKRRVALKLLLAPGGDEGLDAAASARVLREAQMAAALDHANVVAVFDSGEENGVPFIVMELVSGTSLRALVGEPSLPPSERVRILADVARALAAAHRAGLVHRDIKPENVMIREDGTVKVLDFGIARAMEAMEAMTAPDTVPGEAAPAGLSAAFGTPAYMPPERLLRGQYDARADQFAWGVLAYELLAGRSPWRVGDGHSLFAAILGDVPEPLNDAAIGTPPGVAAVVARALAKSADERFPTMDALLAELSRVSTEGGVMVPPRSIIPALSSRSVLPTPDGSSSAATSSGRSPTLPLDMAGPTVSVDPLVRTATQPNRGARASASRWIAVVVALAVVAGGAGLAISRHARPALYAAGDAKRLTFASCAEFPSPVGQSSTVVFDTPVGKDDQLLTLDVTTGAQQLLTKDDGWHLAPQVSPDGRDVVFLLLRGAERATYVMPLDGSSPARLVAKGNVRPSWSPDGTAIWAGDPHHVVRLARGSLTETRVLEPPEGHLIRNVLELADGRSVARVSIAGATGYAGIVIHEHGAFRWLLRSPVAEVLALAPDGKSVLASRVTPDGHTDLWQLPIDGGEPSPVPNGAGASKGIALLSGAQRAVWSSCGSGTRLVAIQRVDGGFGPRHNVESDLFGKWEDRDPVAVPDTSLVVVISDRTGAKQPWVIDREKKLPPRPVDIGGLVPTNPDVSLDGRWLVFGTEGHGIHVASLAPGGPAVLQLTQGVTDASPVFSRDGESVYFTSTVDGNPEIRAVPRTGGASRPLIPGASRPSVAPDGVVGILRRVSVTDSVPETWDPRTEARMPLVQGLPPGEGYGAIRFSADGRHALMRRGDSDVLEIDRATRTVSATFDAGIDSIAGVTYSGDDMVLSLSVWEGDLWTAPFMRR